MRQWKKEYISISGKHIRDTCSKNMMIIYKYAFMSIIQYQLYKSFHNSMCRNIDDNEGCRSNILRREKKLHTIGISEILHIVFVIIAISIIMFLMYEISINNDLTIELLALLALCIAVMYAAENKKTTEWYKTLAVACMYVSILITSAIVAARFFSSCNGSYIKAGNVIKAEIVYPCVVFADAIIVLLYGVYNNGRKTALEESSCYTLMFISIIHLVTTIYTDNIYTQVQNSTRCLLFLFFCFIANNILMILIMQMDTDIKHSYEEDILKIEIENNTKLYDNIIEAKEELRDIRHDLKNRLNSLSYAIELGDYETAGKELGSMLDNINKAGMPDYCENLKVNSIFTYKLSDVPQGVTVNCIVDVPKEMDIDYGDLNVLIGNLIDNSINAVKRIENMENAFIDINLTCSAGNLVFIIKNSYSDEREVRSRDYYVNHGRGIGSVKKILRKYNGSYELQKTDREYETCITAHMYNVGRRLNLNKMS